MVRGGGSGLLPHQIRRVDVDRWLADAIVKTTTFHRTTPEAVREITERGIRISASRIGSFGQGFYTATRSDEFYGPAEIEVAVRLTAPLVGSLDEVSNHVDRIVHRLHPSDPRITLPVAVALRRQLMRDGHDGLIVRDAGGDGIDYIIAIKDGIVRVVAE